jgi:hypothetical protein
MKGKIEGKDNGKAKREGKATPTSMKQINTNIKRQGNDDVREEEEKEAYGSKETTLQRDKK